MVITTSYPRFVNDVEAGGSFIEKLYHNLIDDFDVTVLAPYTDGVNNFNLINDLNVYRYKFIPFNIGKLINNNGLTQTLSSNKWKICLIPFLVIFQLISIIRFVKKFKIDIIHANWFIPQGLVSSIYKKFINQNVKLVITAHGSDLNNSYGKIGSKIIKFVVNNSDKIIVVSDDLKLKLLNITKVNDVSILPMGVDTNKFKPNNISSNAIKNSYGNFDNILLFVGFFRKLKGIDFILEAMPMIVKEHPKTKLLLIGDGEIKPNLEILASKLNITENVDFLGFKKQDELPAYYNAADLVLMPSLSEGSPVVLPEAMSCGSIVLTSDLPIFKQHINDKINGFIVKQKNSKDISEKVNYFLSNKAKYDRVKEFNRNYIISNFEWKQISQEYKSIFDNIILNEN